MKLNLIKTMVFLTPILMSYFLTGCSSCQQQKNKDLVGENINFKDISIIDSVDAVIIALPSPEEIIQYIKSNKVEFDESILVNTKYALKSSSDNIKKQLLGMYFADLAYLSSFSRTDYVPELIKTIDVMMKDLELNPIVSQEIRNTLLNTSSPEDVYNISQQFYDNLINYLYDIDDGKTLTLISTGVFYEVMYISTNLHSNYDLYKNSIYKIGEQKLLYEDLLSMAQILNNYGLQDSFNDLKALEKAFNLISFDSEIDEVYESDDNVLHIKSKNNTVEISNEKYTDFCQAVAQVRNKIIENLD